MLDTNQNTQHDSNIITEIPAESLPMVLEKVRIMLRLMNDIDVFIPQHYVDYLYAIARGLRKHGTYGNTEFDFVFNEYLRERIKYIEKLLNKNHRAQKLALSFPQVPDIAKIYSLDSLVFLEKSYIEARARLYEVLIILTETEKIIDIKADRVMKYPENIHTEI